jgi:hypothetical protein
MSQQYIAAVALIIGSILKAFGIEIENAIIESLVFGGLALWIAIRRKQQGDITAFGAYKR